MELQLRQFDLTRVEVPINGAVEDRLVSVSHPITVHTDSSYPTSCYHPRNYILKDCLLSHCPLIFDANNFTFIDGIIFEEFYISIASLRDYN